ncbi:MAG: NAD(P)-dependent oxidoreductase [Paracoccaceae bacterium]|nr:NAD(P)-dependent oxidoreductase [Paracoccaceae bacterium]
MTKLAFLGLGAMGRRMAKNLIAAGHDVTVWNRSPGAADGLGANTAASPAEAVGGAEMAISMVTDDDAARAVWLGADGALAALPPGALAIEASTVSPGWVAELAAAAGERGSRLVDAPVAGSRPQAEAGELVFLAGGAADDIARFDPVAKAMGKAVLHAGGTGRGAVLKLMVNGLLAVQTAALAELLAFGAKGGLDPETAVALLTPVPVTSPAAAFVAGQIARGAHEPLFTVDLMEKDLGYLLQGAILPLMAETRARFAAAAMRGHGARHITAIALE